MVDDGAAREVGLTPESEISVDVALLIHPRHDLLQEGILSLDAAVSVELFPESATCLHPNC
jgi:hypothetical protein